MSQKGYKIGPVPRRARSWAIGFLAGGRQGRVFAAHQADALEQIVLSRPREAVWLWWARRRLRCLAVAMIVESPGKAGMLYHCPADAPGVSAEALTELIAAVSRDALGSGLALVQALPTPTAAADLGVLAAAGYEPLAELVYMRRDLAKRPETARDDSLTWRSYGQFDEEELGRVIAATYEGSCDCPKLRGTRTVDQIIAGHKVSGSFVPQSWWIVDYDGTPAGCVLVNDSPDRSAAELIYLGVVKARRGLGLGRKMVQRAAADAHSRGRAALTLAVDAGNLYAKSIYDVEGFGEVTRRLGRVIFAGAAPNTPK